MLSLTGYQPFETIVETPQFSLLRVQDNLHHENFIAKVYRSPTEKQVQSVKNIVNLVKEEEWSDVLQPISYMLEKDAVAIIVYVKCFLPFIPMAGSLATSDRNTF